MPGLSTVSAPPTIVREISIHTDNSDKEQRLGGGNSSDSGGVAPPTRTLSPVSSNAMNVLSPSSQQYDHKASIGTIRSVPSEPNTISSSSEEAAPRSHSKSESYHISSTTEEARRAQSKSEQMPHSIIKQSPSVPTIQTSSLHPPLSRQPSIPLPQNSIVRTISAEFGPSRTFNTSPAPENNDIASPNGTNGANGQWSSAVGRANLGKSGRVIERLMGENDMLKRDLNLSRLLAEESKQAVKMAEGRMEALTGEYEGRLHDAAINKTLLKRRERQLTDLRSQVEAEKERADKAVESERGWREQMELVERESKRRVEEAQLYAALMEGRNKALTSHWKEQGLEVEKTVSKMKEEIGQLVEERKGDDRRMNMLEGLCGQQAEELGRLREEKDNIGRGFEEYKRAQEELLSGIKAKTKEQERRNDEVLEESQKVLGKLKWALGVKNNVRDAQ